MPTHKRPVIACGGGATRDPAAQPAPPTSADPTPQWAGQGTKRAQRRSQRIAQQVSAWWQHLPDTQRAQFYAVADIETATQVPAETLGPALRLLNWTREQIRVDGVATVVWVPPGQPSAKRPRGRPSIRDLIAHNDFEEPLP